jgi:ribosomal protein L29
MNAKELREKNQGELAAMRDDLRKQARELRFALSTRETKTHRTYRAAKRDIARIETILRENEVNLDGSAEKR